MDRRSTKCLRRETEELPVEIMEHIMSFMDYATVIRASAVSKAWRSALPGRTCLEITDDFILPSCARSAKKISKDLLSSKVRRMLISAARFIQIAIDQNLQIQKFSLRFQGQYHGSILAPLYHLLLCCIGEGSLREFVFDIGRKGMSSNYSLLIFNYCSARSLDKLVVGGLNLVLFENMDGVNLPLLRELHLMNNPIDDSSLELLIMNCPQLVTLKISDCTGFNAFKVLGSHHKLKRIELIGDFKEVGTIEIKEAPELEYFCYLGNGRVNLDILDIQACKCLTILELTGFRGDNDLIKSVEQLVSNLNVLQSFKLHNFTWALGIILVERFIRISSNSLRELWLGFCNYGGVDVQVDAPYLCKFVYCGGIRSKLSFGNLSMKDANFVMYAGNTKLCYKFFEFLQNFNHFEHVRLDDFAPLHFRALTRCRHANFLMNAPLWDVKHLTIGARYSCDNRYIPVNLHILETLLWMAPKLNSLSFDDLKSSLTFQFIHDKSRKVEDTPFISQNNKMIKVKVESCPGKGEGSISRKYFFNDGESLAGKVQGLGVVQTMSKSHGDC